MSSGYKIPVCIECDKAMPSKRPNARFCSRCLAKRELGQNRVDSRNYRLRKKALLGVRVVGC